MSLLLSLACANAIADVVNVNKADAQTLQANLTGIGEVRAKAITE